MKNTNFKIRVAALVGFAFFTQLVFAGNPLQKSSKRFALAKNVSSKDYLSNTVIVKIDPNLKSSLGKSSIGVPASQSVLNKVGVAALNQMFPNSSAIRKH